MTKLLIFIRENQRFDVELTIGAIVAMNGVRNANVETSSARSSSMSTAVQEQSRQHLGGRSQTAWRN
jgi:hypothetical protein